MIVMKKIVVSILFVLAFCGSSNAEVDHIKVMLDISTLDKNQLTKLSGKQIKEKVTDKKFFTMSITDIETPEKKDMFIFEDTHYKNGDILLTTYELANPTNTFFSHKGKWKVKKDEICYKYQGDEDFFCSVMYEKVEGSDAGYYWEYNEPGIINAKTFRVIDLNKIVEPNTLKSEANLIKKLEKEENWTKKQAQCLIQKTKPLVPKKDWNTYVKAMNLKEDEQDDLRDEDAEMMIGIAVMMMGNFSKCGISMG